MKQYKKRIFGILLSFALMLTMMPVLGLNLTAYAGTENPYANLVNTTTSVKFNNMDWYIIADDSTAVHARSVTLLAKECIDSGKSNNEQYANSNIKASLDGMTNDGGTFADVADAILSVDLTDKNVSGAKLYLPNATELSDVPSDLLKCNRASGADHNRWWLRSTATNGNWHAVDGDKGTIKTSATSGYAWGVRPALKLDLSKVAFDSSAKKFSVATQPVSYMAWNETDKKVEKVTNPCTDYTEVVSSDDDVTWEGGSTGNWFVVKSDATLSKRITVNGTVNLILCDGAKLTASKGITVEGTNALNIYPGSTAENIVGSGQLDASVENNSYNAAIGSAEGPGGGDAPACGKVTIHGGEVKANGKSNSAGIGGGVGGAGGTVTIYGGKVTSTGCTGIGGGHEGNGGTVTIYGGEVTATSNRGGSGAGIGAGYGGAGGTVTVHGGEVTATSNSAGAGIGGGMEGNGGTVTIYGGEVTATSYGEGAGIGGGWSGSGGNVDIYGGSVTATGGEGAKGIGAGESGRYNGNLVIGTGVKLETSTNNKDWTDSTSTPSTRTRYMRTTYSSHEHAFTYSASGSTITAKCSADDCPLPESSSGAGDHVATLTIAAPESLAYDGTAKAAVITDENKIQGSAKVKYAKKTGESTYDTETETAPTDAGTYKASITLGEATASVEYSITATPLTITGATLTSRDYVKDKKDVAVTAVAFDGGTPTLGTDFTATAVMADDTAGDSKAVTVTVTLSNTNYSLATNTYQTTVKINKAMPATPAAPTAASKTDTSVTLKATDGYQYKCNENEWQDSNEFTGLTEDTSYNFYQRVKGDANHNDSASSPVAVIKTNQEPIDYAVVSKSGNKLIITIRTLTEYIKAVNTDHTVWLENGNFYVVKGTVTLNRGLVYSGNVTIILCDNSKLTIKGGIWHYGSELTIYGQSGQSGQIVVEGNKDLVIDNAPEGADISKISKTSALDGGKININGGKLSVTPGQGQDVCGTNAKVTFLSNVSLTGTTEGEEKVTLTEGTYGPTELNQFKSFVTKESATVKTEPTAKSLTENGSAQQLVTAGEAENGTMQYALGKDATTVPTSGWGEAIPTGTNAGTYYVWYKAKGDDLYGDSLPVCVTVKISEKSAPTPSKVSGTQTARMTAGKKSMTIAWNKIQGADGYDIFLAHCSKNTPCKIVKSIKGNKTFKWTKSGLKKNTSYKAYVKAYTLKNGKKTYVRTSPMLHAYTGNASGKYTNAKSVTVNKTKVSLKKGKTFKIKAKVNKLKKNKKLMPKSHIATLRYLTSNSKVATVSKSGKITAKGKGSCVVYVYAHNGVSKQVKITVNK